MADIQVCMDVGRLSLHNTAPNPVSRQRSMNEERAGGLLNSTRKYLALLGLVPGREVWAEVN
jgi:hypothetical protein